MFLDISKAFDRVWHKGLLFKLKSIGIDGPLYLLLENYLKNRKHRLVLNGQTSEWKDISAGVPQDSVLGPLLFLIYINDLLDGLISNAKSFAVINDPTVSCHNLNSDLLKINNWAYQCKMNFNPDPYKQAAEVIFSQKVEHHLHPPIYFNNVPVVTQPFTKHLSEKICKANKGVGLLKKLRHKLCRKHLITIYKSNIRPHLDYCDIIYDQPPHIDSFINKVE